MIRPTIVLTGVLALAAFATVGCQQPQADMTGKMEWPERSAELDHLDMFAGEWEATGELKVTRTGEVMTGTSTLPLGVRPAGAGRGVDSRG